MGHRTQMCFFITLDGEWWSCLSPQSAHAHQLFANEYLVAGIVFRRHGVVGRHAKPGVAMAHQSAFEVPGCDMGGDARVQQLLRGNAPFGQFRKMNGIDLGHAHIDGAIGVALHHVGSHGGFHLQNGPQDLRAHALLLCGGDHATFGRGCKGSVRCVGRLGAGCAGRSCCQASASRNQKPFVKSVHVACEVQRPSRCARGRFQGIACHEASASASFS
jgi:hypothetical protein